VILDIDVAGSVAPGAKIVVYFAPNTVQGWIDAITTAIHDSTNRPSTISISWAGGESGWGSAINNVSSAIAEAHAMGVTIFVSSGDGGSGNPAEVLYPASDPG
jgi:kumamolisin